MKSNSRMMAGIRTGNFSKTVSFLTEVLNLQVKHYDKGKEFAQFKLPSGQTLELFGLKNIWHPFSTSPNWELIIADVRHREEQI